MKQLTTLQSITLAAGAILMAVGAILYIVTWQWRGISCWLYLAGAIAFATIGAMQTYQGRNIVVRRLKRIQALAGLLFVVAGMLMVNDTYQLTAPLFEGRHVAYVNYLYNKWVLLLLSAALIQLYTTLRIASELEKDKKT